MGRRPFCTYCKFNGHTIEQCYKRNGYPPVYTPRPASFNNQYRGQAHSAVTIPPTGSPGITGTLSNLRLSREQYDQLQAYVCDPIGTSTGQSSSGGHLSTSSPYNAAAFVSSVTNPAGPCFGEEDWYG
ncbi:unnamed protein product, partial [Linum tenue]